MPVDVTIEREQTTAVDAIAVSQLASTVDSSDFDVDVTVLQPGGDIVTIQTAPVIDVTAEQSAAVIVQAVAQPVIDVIAIEGATIVTQGSASDLVDLTARDSINQDLIYIGRSSSTDLKDPSAADWQIYRYDSEAAGFVELYADGNTAFDNIWNDRESLIY